MRVRLPATKPRTHDPRSEPGGGSRRAALKSSSHATAKGSISTDAATKRAADGRNEPLLVTGNERFLLPDAGR